MADALDFALLSLATWRLSHLLSSEDGPAGIFARLRTFAGARKSLNGGWEGVTFFGNLLSCPLCLSIWWATLLYLSYKYVAYGEPVVAVLAISGAACILELAIDR